MNGKCHQSVSSSRVTLNSRTMYAKIPKTPIDVNARAGDAGVDGTVDDHQEVENEETQV